MLDFVRRHIVIIIIAIVVSAGLFLIDKNDTFEAQIETNFEQEIELVEQEEDEFIETSILVDVKGQVEKPGVYEMSHDARITDVISISGGFTELADEAQINLAQKVQDEMVIFVPKKGEELPAISPVNITGSDQHTDKVNINHATKEEIETLNGIGPKKAQTIIDYREENGPFQSVDDLMNISGIGEKTVENIKENIIIR